jgi:arylsulfatase A-like enzyme
VVIVAVDTLRPDHLGCYGYPRPTSPGIDRFAESGALFENVRSQAPWTLPSFATVFTSLYPTQHGADEVKTRMRTGFPALAEILARHGYATGAVINAPALKPANGVDRGFSFYDMTPLGGRNAKGTTRDALAWIDGLGGEPFFAFVHYFDPHLPYSPPQGYADRFEEAYEGSLGASFNLEGFSRVRRIMFEQMKDLAPEDWEHIVALYDGEIAFTDEAVVELLEGLEQRGLADNTLVVFLSDHGEEFFEHGGFEHGHCLYDEVIKVPLILRMPGIIPAGVRLSRQVRLIDVAPTILDLVGIPAPAHFEGASLKPMLTGNGGPPARENCLLPPGVAFSEALMHGREQKSVTAFPTKLIHSMDSGEDLVFDLEQDPFELEDLGSGSPGAARLRHLLYQTLFGLSDSWYVELSGEGQRFDLEITARRGPTIGLLEPVRLMEGQDRYGDPAGLVELSEEGEALSISGLDLDGVIRLALKSQPDRIPLNFDCRIDGRASLNRVFLGKSAASPDLMPFSQKTRPGAKAAGRPPRRPEPPYVLIWFEQTPFRGETSITLDPQTKQELKSLGYIQ